MGLRHSLDRTETNEVLHGWVDALKGSGVDVIITEDVDELVGRTPLAVMSQSTYGLQPIVSSFAEDVYCGLSAADGKTFPGKYYFCCSYEPFTKNCFQITCRPRDDETADVIVGRYDHRLRKYVKLGAFTYSISYGIAKVSGKPNVSMTINNGYGSKDIRVVEIFNGVEYYSENSFSPATDQSTSIGFLIGRAITKGDNGTGIMLASGYSGIWLEFETVPTMKSKSPFSHRMSLPQRTGGYWNSSGIDFGPAETFDPLPPESESLALERLRQAMSSGKGTEIGRKYGWGGESRSAKAVYGLALGAAKEGTRRPIGHVYVLIDDGQKTEFGEIAVAKVSADFGMADVYMRKEDDGEYHRCMGRSLTAAKDLFSNCVLIKETLVVAKNLRNRYAVGAVASTPDSASVSLSDVSNIAKLRFGSGFVEQLLKRGETELAYAFVEAINDRRAWNSITSLSDVIPGGNPDGTTIHGVLNLPKAWAELAFDTYDYIIKVRGERYSADVTTLGRACGIVRIAMDLAAYRNGGKAPANPSEDDKGYVTSLEYVDIFGGIMRTAYRRVSFQDWMTGAFENPAEMAEALRSYGRMLRKVPDFCRSYVNETFEAYCQLKGIGIDPEAEGVLYEYGIPETGDDDVKEMVSRRCEAAQRILENHRAALDAHQRDVVEAQYEATKSKLHHLRRDIGPYSFFVPSKIYGEDDPFSVEHEGAAQQNCVFRSYADQIAKGTYTIVLMRSSKDKDSALVTIGINGSNVIDQTYGFRDHAITLAQAEGIREFVDALPPERRPKLTRPGGWPAEA